MQEEIMIFAKFGEQKHLEMLKNGIVYLNPISKYRSDSTLYRGDKNEGMVPLDPTKIKLLDENGNNLFDKIRPPDSVKKAFVGDDDLLIFCVSMITTKMFRRNHSNKLVLTDNYKNAIKDFGESVLLFWPSEFLKLLKTAQKNAIPPFGFDGRPIIYRDLSDFSKDGDYFNAYNTTGNNLDHYFVKSSNYKEQNEWRLIVGNANEPLPKNDDGSYIINIGKMEYATLADTEIFLNTFTVIEE